MGSNFKGVLQKSANFILRNFDLELVRKHSWDDPKTYIPFKQTIAEAKKTGLSVGEYIDNFHQCPGATQETIDQLVRLSVLNDTIERVCEIGPGSGRYLEKTIEVCKPSYYEIYETAEEWAKYLVRKYGVIRQPTDGYSLSSTPTLSIDLIHAHRVFMVTPFLTTISYFMEMARVVRSRGIVVFDAITDECLDTINLEKWFTSGIRYGPFPSCISRQIVTCFFINHGYMSIGNFFVFNNPAITQYFIFTRYN